MSSPKVAVLAISCMILAGSSPALGNHPGGGGNQNMGNWMDMARGYGWINHQLTGNYKPKGSARVRTSLGTYRAKLETPAPGETVGNDPKNKPARVKPAKPVQARPDRGKPAKRKFSWFSKPKPKASTPASASASASISTARATKPAAAHTPKELKNLKPPPGVRAIRRVPTRVRSR